MGGFFTQPPGNWCTLAPGFRKSATLMGMVFSSVSFLFGFLPVVLLLYHGVFFLPAHLGRPTRHTFQLSNAFLLLVSVAFYFWGERYLVLLFLATTAVD